MNITERRLEIQRLLHSNEFVEIQELAEKFDVASMTIRRDLKYLERQGFVYLQHGRAYLNEDAAGEPSFSLKMGFEMKEKANIGKEAAKLVSDGDTIFIDCGTTVLQMLKYLSAKHVTIITNSWPAINYIGNFGKNRLILAPGEYSDISAGVFGTMTVEFIRRYHIDKVFIGSHGCSVQAGATVPEIGDAEVKRAILEAGKEKVLLVDATKFDQVYFAKHAELEDFDCVITNYSLSEEKRQELNQHCKNVIYVK